MIDLYDDYEDDDNDWYDYDEEDEEDDWYWKVVEQEQGFWNDSEAIGEWFDDATLKDRIR